MSEKAKKTKNYYGRLEIYSFSKRQTSRTDMTQKRLFPLTFTTLLKQKDSLLEYNNQQRYLLLVYTFIIKFVYIHPVNSKRMRRRNIVVQ